MCATLRSHNTSSNESIKAVVGRILQVNLVFWGKESGGFRGSSITASVHCPKGMSDSRAKQWKYYTILLYLFYMACTQTGMDFFFEVVK